MRVRIDLAVDREPELLIEQLVTPLDAHLRGIGAGEVVHHVVDRLLLVMVDVQLAEGQTMDSVLEFLANAKTPIGTVISQIDSLGRKSDIFVFAGPPAE
jgi:hypothetical protein